MAVKDEHLAAINKLFRTQTVVVLTDLLRALRKRSAVTVFHVLKAMGYYTSYSHKGRYYTLERIPKFDDLGLWHYRDIGFSRHGTLRATIVFLVDQSPAGRTHEELEPILKLGVQNTLLFLVKAGRLRRELITDTYVYFSTGRARAAQQEAERRKLAPPPAGRAALPLPGQVTPAILVALLLDLIHHPGHDVKDVCRQLGAQGLWITPEQVESIFRYYDIKKLSALAPGARGVKGRDRLSPRVPKPAVAGAGEGVGCRRRTLHLP
jgi:hypothetical protein